MMRSGTTYTSGCDSRITLIDRGGARRPNGREGTDISSPTARAARAQAMADLCARRSVSSSSQMKCGQCRRRVGTARCVPPWFADTLTQYLEFVERHRGLAPRTVRQYARKLSAFAEYLEQGGVTQLGAITPRHVREFYENALGGRPRRSYGSSLRAFFRWASTQSALPMRADRCCSSAAAVSAGDPSRCAHGRRGRTHRGGRGSLDARRAPRLRGPLARRPLWPAAVRHSAADTRPHRLASGAY